MTRVLIEIRRSMSEVGSEWQEVSRFSSAVGKKWWKVERIFEIGKILQEIIIILCRPSTGIVLIAGCIGLSG